MIVYDPERWKHCENITIGQLIENIKIMYLLMLFSMCAVTASFISMFRWMEIWYAWMIVLCPICWNMKAANLAN